MTGRLTPRSIFDLARVLLLLAHTGGSLRGRDMSAIEGEPDSLRRWLGGPFLTRSGHSA